MTGRIATKRIAAVFAMCAALALGPTATRASAADSGTITGVVKYEGKPPARVPVDITKDKEVCGARPHYDESLIVAPDGGIRNAVVVVKGAPGAVKPAPAIFDQKGCDYTPHVLAFPAGSSVQILNSDGILHNVHAFRGEKTILNMAQPGFKKEIKTTIAQPGVIRVSCDAHGWMQGWWYVTDTPYYAVTDASGRFTIKDVPPGDYTLEVWQEKLGTQDQKVEVKPGATATANFALKPK
jgi:plastocyanin